MADAVDSIEPTEGEGGGAGDDLADVRSILGRGFRSMARTLAKADADGIDEKMLDVLARVAQSGETERTRVTAAKALTDILAARMKLALDRERLEIERQKAIPDQSADLPPIPEFDDGKERGL